MPLTQGQILNNRYRIVKLLGQGGFGAVYKAWDLNFEVVCAIKENFETSAEAQRQFLREARLLHVLRHPNLPLVKDHFVIPGQGQYLVMDFVEGQDLEELRCAAGGKLPEAQVLNWALQVCEALEYMHRQPSPVIHRDLKPANIKITPAGHAMLVDFGIAKTYDPLLKTTLGARAVTPGYSPIEQYGTGVTDARSDIYSLGATLYTLLTGQEPPEAPQRVLHDALIPPRLLNPAISPAISPTVEAALLHALQVDPDQRFQSAAEFRKELSDQLPVASVQFPVVAQPVETLSLVHGNAGGIAAATPSPLTPATMRIPQPARRFPLKWVGVGAGVLVGLALLAVVAVLAGQGMRESWLTQTAQAQGNQTAAALAAILSQTPTLTEAATPVPPTPTPQPPTPTATLGPGATQVSPVDGMVMSYIPAGTFLMGSEDGEDDERPVHSVTLAAFWMDQTEVTNAMYTVFLNIMGNQSEGGVNWLDAADENVDIHQQGGEWQVDAGRESNPAREASWYGAAAYCAWAGRGLPTEAQWEYAARGGLVGAVYPWGDESPSCTLGVQNGAQYDSCSPDDTIPVASFAPNGYGLYDMAGNVWEWVMDWYSPYSGTAVENPSGAESGDGRVLRGGSWNVIREGLRASNRIGDAPEDTGNTLGFRCARPETEDVDVEPTLVPVTPVPTATPVLSISSTQVSSMDGMVQMYIPAGTFQMGSESGSSDEQPVHSVTLDAFWMDQTEVTNGMYAQCVADGVCSPPDRNISFTRNSYYGNAAYADYPVILVDWNQAAAYCAWAGRELPTEAQWEYAARGGLAGATYPWGDEAPSCTLGAQNGAQFVDCSLTDTISVGNFAPNGYGLYDVAGNVWEWVADRVGYWYGSYSSDAVENPSGSGSGSFRVLRVGSWGYNENDLRVSNRLMHYPDNTSSDFGFRCSLSMTLGF